jgi:hypothetical protein
MLGARAADLEEVAYSLGTQRQPTALWLAACQGLGLVERHGDAYRLGPTGRELLAAADQPQSAPTTEPAESHVRDALWAALVGCAPTLPPTVPAPASTAPLLSAPLVPFHCAPRDPPHARRAYRALEWLHAPAADALTAALPLPAAGLVLEVGGQGLYARAILARAPGLHAVVADAESWALVAADVPQGELAGSRLRAIPTLAALADRPTIAVVAQTLHSEGPAALRTRLQAVRPRLRQGATIAVVGAFSLGEPDPFAAIVALVELADGLPGWYPPVETVEQAMRAAGIAPSQRLALPAPNAAVVGRVAS